MDGVTGVAERADLGDLEVGGGGQTVQVIGPAAVDVDAPGTVAGPAELEPESRGGKGAQDVGGGPTHAEKKVDGFIHVIEDTQSDGHVVGVFLVDLFPALLTDIDQTGILGRFSLGQAHHGVGRVDPGDMDAGAGQRTEEGSAATPDVEGPPGTEGHALVDGEVEPVEQRSPSEGAGHLFTAVEGGEPPRPTMEIGLELSLRHRRTSHFHSG